MECPEFLDRYTEFRDGVVTTPRDRRRFERHLAGCETCRSYDTAVRRGVLALQGAATLSPSADFRARLDARLRREALTLAGPIIPPRVGAAAALLLAAGIAIVALEVAHRPPPLQAHALPPVPFPRPVAQAGVPFVTFQDPRATTTAGNPIPYGSALVEPVSTHR
jgi:hypothetical protein